MASAEKDGRGAVFIREATGLTRQLGAKDAVMYNMLGMGVPWSFLYLYFAALLFPGVDLPITVLASLPLTFIIASTYYLFSVALPRTGGDFVWVGRIIHPAIGFANNLALGIFALSFLGPTGAWLFSYGIGTMLINLGTITGNTGYSALGAQLSQPIPGLIAGLIVLVVILIPALGGLRWSFRFMWACFALTIIGVLTFLVVMATTSNADFVARFNSMSGANYANIIKAAKDGGYITSFTLSGTLFGSVFSFLNLSGYNSTTYIGGEVKNPGKTQLWGVLGSAAFFSIVMFLVFQTAYSVMGQPFLHAASYLAGNSNAAWTLPSSPVLQYLVIFASPNPIVAILVPLAIVSSVFGALEAILVLVVRLTFSWSFDRVIPTKFADLDSRWSSPIYALLLVFVIGLFFVLVNTLYPKLLQFLSYATSGSYVVLAVVGIAAVLLPFRRKDIFNAAPPQVRKKGLFVGLGLATCVGSLIVAGLALSPAWLQATTGGASISPVNIAGLVATFAFGIVVYYISQGVRKRQWIDLRFSMKEIPPE